MARFAWWKEASPDARRALLAASFGWMLDSFDVMLYAMVLAALMSDLGMAKTTAGLLGSLTLVASAVGRPRLRRRRRPVRPPKSPDGQHPHLFDLHRGLRFRHGRRHAGRLPGLPRPRAWAESGPAGPPSSPRPGRPSTAARPWASSRAHGPSATPQRPPSPRSSCPSGAGGASFSSASSRRSSRCGSRGGSRNPRSGKPSARRPRASGRASARSSAGSACA